MKEYIKQVSILYVEDEESIRDGYMRALKRYSKELYVAKDGLEGLELYIKYNPDIVLTDINMPRKNGVEMAQEIKSINPEQTIIFTTAHTESDYTIKALNMQVDGYLIKPVDKKKLKNKLSIVSKNILIERYNKRTNKILQKILDAQTSLTILTDFKIVEFASKSFYNLFGVQSSRDFHKLYNNFLDSVVHHKNYLDANTKEGFLEAYNSAQKEDRIVSIPSAICDVKVFYIEIDKVDELFVLTLTDITEIQFERLDSDYRATHDKLTGVFNRAKFEDKLEAKFQNAKRYKRDLSIAILDIDFFKKVNDEHGHQIGDDILKELSKLCLKNIRTTDFFARWGGEEFVLLLEETDLKSAKIVCEKLRVTIQNNKSQNLPAITVSIGISQFKENDTKEEFFKRADKALYKAKQSGRNKVVLDE